MRPGQVERHTHDYTRHGTLTLFAALDAATGKVIGRCYPRDRGREFLSFLHEIERNVPPELEAAVNDDPKPFRWTKSADNILAAIKRFCASNRSKSPEPKPKSHETQNQDTGL